MAALFEDWLEVRGASWRPLSPRSIEGYRADVARWATLIAPTGAGPPLDRWSVEHLTGPAIVRALQAMADAGLSADARKRTLAPLRSLCAWLEQTGSACADPARDRALDIRAAQALRPGQLSAELVPEGVGLSRQRPNRLLTPVPDLVRRPEDQESPTPTGPMRWYPAARPRSPEPVARGLAR